MLGVSGQAVLAHGPLPRTRVAARMAAGMSTRITARMTARVTARMAVRLSVNRTVCFSRGKFRMPVHENAPCSNRSRVK